MHEKGDVVRGMVSEKDFGRIVEAIVASVEISFLDGASLRRTEIRRRTDLSWELVKRLRGDLKWGVEKILDHLAAYLRCELDGIPYNPEKVKGLWTPDTIAENAATFTRGR